MSNKARLKEKKHAFRLMLLFALMVFSIMLITSFFIIAGMYVLYEIGLLRNSDFVSMPLFLFAIISIVLGTIISFLISNRPLSPLRELLEATDKIAKGDYSVRVNPQGISDFRELGEKFNHMAQELSSVEVLRTNFINDFSHEFKTPIVSIRGFAKALKWENLSEQERNEYLDIIINESERLATLSTNVLYLNKIEKQTIVTDVKRINVSEQIRLVVALLYEKISSKKLEIVMDESEKFASCNEELFRQVWINLIDNAIKFSPQGGKIEIRIQEFEDKIAVNISDNGIGMSEEMIKHVFDKFYQGENSRITHGNGLGLAIAKRIVTLHGFDIYASSDGKSGSQFVVEMKK